MPCFPEIPGRRHPSWLYFRIPCGMAARPGMFPHRGMSRADNRRAPYAGHAGAIGARGHLWWCGRRRIRCAPAPTGAVVITIHRGMGPPPGHAKKKGRRARFPESSRCVTRRGFIGTEATIRSLSGPPAADELYSSPAGSRAVPPRTLRASPCARRPIPSGRIRHGGAPKIRAMPRADDAHHPSPFYLRGSASNVPGIQSRSAFVLRIQA